MMTKKKREAEARAKAEAEAKAKAAAAAAAPKKGKPGWYKVSNGPVPVARPADYIQLTPIVQPIPLQPLAMYDDSWDPTDEDSEY